MLHTWVMSESDMKSIERFCSVLPCAIRKYLFVRVWLRPPNQYHFAEWEPIPGQHAKVIDEMEGN
jgi:hypothetical protein